LPKSLHIFDGSQPSLIFTEKQQPDAANINYSTIPFDEQLPQRILDELFRRKIISVLIEGGARLLQSFIDAGLWDEARIFTGKTMFGDGVKAPVTPQKISSEKHLNFEHSTQCVVYR
jgi:diaminohydroxyphosphoribosylaminopyrimidine deaminase/5-amino-6-(5-phosphoribosylamino)uracil reductase